MSVNLTKVQKGQRLNLSKVAPGLKIARMELGWSENLFDTGGDLDLDASAFLLGQDGKVPNGDTRYFVYYYNLGYPYIDPVADLGLNPAQGPADPGYSPAMTKAYQDGKLTVYHAGDNRTGKNDDAFAPDDRDAPDETIFVDLSKVPADIDRIAFIVTINPPASGPMPNFGQVEDAFIRLVNAETGEAILQYDLSNDFPVETAVVFAELYRRKDGDWGFNPIGNGYAGGLAALCQRYGIDAEYQ